MLLLAHLPRVEVVFQHHGNDKGRPHLAHHQVHPGGRLWRCDRHPRHHLAADPLDRCVDLGPALRLLVFLGGAEEDEQNRAQQRGPEQAA